MASIDMPRTHDLLLDGSRFWILHRRRQYGPFDYEWSPDLRGVEFHYAGEKFGEYCNPEEFHADLRHFRLPMSVVRVATITLASIVLGVLEGRTEHERGELIAERLRQFGYGRFVAEEQRDDHPPV